MLGRPRLVCVGLDGATWRVLRPAMESGELAVFKRLCDSGAHGVLMSTIPSQTSAAMPSLFTGKNPGQIGVFAFTKPDGSLFQFSDIGHEVFWETLSRHGLRSCIVGPRGTYPPQPFKGVLVTGELTSARRDYTYPAAVAEKIGDFHCDDERDEIGRLLKARNGHEQRLYELELIQHQRRYEIFRQLAVPGEYDAVMYWDVTTDGIQHECWSRPDLMVTFYQHMETMLEQMMERYPGANFLVVSDHGGQPAYTRLFHINSWLRELGLLAEKPWSLTRSVLPQARRWAKKVLPKKLQRRLSRVVVRQEPEARRRSLPDHFLHLPWVDWSQTKACMDQSWGISVLVDGDEGEHGAIRRRILDELPKVTDEAGQPVVREAWPKEELYSGTYLPEIPDIVFLLHDGFYADLAPARQLVTQRWDKPREPATHVYAPEGLFLAFGPDIKEGLEIDAKIVDVAPTILHMMDCAIPDDMDGRPLCEVLREGGEPGGREPRFASPEAPQQREGKAYSAEDEELVRERLRQLGYLE